MLIVKIVSGKYANEIDKFIVYGSTRSKFLINNRGWIWVNHVDCEPCEQNNK